MTVPGPTTTVFQMPAFASRLEPADSGALLGLEQEANWTLNAAAMPTTQPDKRVIFRIGPKLV